eukprot:scaffold211916_cov31-Tisochrysis_lutea.AAC.9
MCSIVRPAGPIIEPQLRFAPASLLSSALRRGGSTPHSPIHDSSGARESLGGGKGAPSAGTCETSASARSLPKR